jgi:hypothetical protein
VGNQRTLMLCDPHIQQEGLAQAQVAVGVAQVQVVLSHRVKNLLC